jgi:hypothetical protein
MKLGLHVGVGAQENRQWGERMSENHLASMTFSVTFVSIGCRNFGSYLLEELIKNQACPRKPKKIHRASGC